MELGREANNKKKKSWCIPSNTFSSVSLFGACTLLFIYTLLAKTQFHILEHVQHIKSNTRETVKRAVHTSKDVTPRSRIMLNSDRFPSHQFDLKVRPLKVFKGGRRSKVLCAHGALIETRIKH